MNEKDYAVYAGETFSRTWICNDVNAAAVPLDGVTAKMQIRARPGGELIASAATTVTAAEGKIVFTVSAAVTAVIAPGTYYYDIKLSDSAGNAVFVRRGKFIILQPVTE